MNRLDATVTAIREHEGVSRIVFDANGTSLAMVGLEPPHGLTEGCGVTLGIKATHIILSLGRPEGLGLFNALPVTVTRMERGEILTSLRLSYHEKTLEAITPSATADALSLETGLSLWALFQESELSILEVKS